VHRLLVTDNLVPSSPILAALMMDALCSSETLVLTRATWRNIPEDGIRHLSPCRNTMCVALTSYKEEANISWMMKQTVSMLELSLWL
jgi:hypothetical protein